jgi:hypothetical protein
MLLSDNVIDELASLELDDFSSILDVPIFETIIDSLSNLK